MAVVEVQVAPRPHPSARLAFGHAVRWLQRRTVPALVGPGRAEVQVGLAGVDCSRGGRNPPGCHCCRIAWSRRPGRWRRGTAGSAAGLAGAGVGGAQPVPPPPVDWAEPAKRLVHQRVQLRVARRPTTRCPARRPRAPVSSWRWRSSRRRQPSAGRASTVDSRVAQLRRRGHQADDRTGHRSSPRGRIGDYDG